MYFNIINQIGYFFGTFKVNEIEYSFYLKDSKWKLLVKKEEVLILDKTEVLEYIDLLNISKEDVDILFYADIISYGMCYHIHNQEDFTYRKIIKLFGLKTIEESINNFEKGLKEILTKLSKPSLTLIKS